jgi:enoyl-CoA hydratase/carnithine racemase
MGFVNRVVTAADVASQAEALAREIAEKPSVPIVITKEHVNAVTQAMSTGVTSFGDGDALLGASLDSESQDAMRRYVATRLTRKNKGDSPL